MFSATVKILKREGKKSQTFQKCCSFSGEGSKRSVRLTLAAAWLCNANSAHPQTDPCEPSRRLHRATPEPADLNAASVSHTLTVQLSLRGIAAQKRLLEELRWTTQGTYMCELEFSKLLWCRPEGRKKIFGSFSWRLDDNNYAFILAKAHQEDETPNCSWHAAFLARDQHIRKYTY